MAMTSVGPVARAAVFSEPDSRAGTTRMSTPPGRASAAMPASAARESLAARGRAPRAGLTG